MNLDHVGKLLLSVDAALLRAKTCIVATCTEPHLPNNPRGYDKACPNHADAVELAQAHSAIEDALEELRQVEDMIDNPEAL